MTVVAGWRERVDIPSLDLSLDAKLDTGATGCALHATDLEPLDDGRIRFRVPLDAFAKQTVQFEAELLDWRYVKDSSGHGGLRPFVSLEFMLAGEAFREEVSLSDRLGLRHRLLLGRSALRGRYIVDPDHSFVLTGSPQAEPAATGVASA